MAFLLLIPIIPMALSDFRFRKIPLWGLLLLFALCLPISVHLYGWQNTSNHIVWNTLLLFYLGIGILCYLRIRYHCFINPFKKHLGLGDFLFALALTPWFTLERFLIFLLASMAGGLLWWVVNGRKGSIPLVGILGIVLGIYLIVT